MPSKLIGILSCRKPVLGFASKKSQELGKILDIAGIRLGQEN